MPTSAIQTLAFSHSWGENSQNGTSFDYYLTFADGAYGVATAKSNPPKYRVGEVVEYNFTGKATPKGDPKIAIKYGNRMGGGHPPQQQQQQNWQQPPAQQQHQQAPYQPPQQQYQAPPQQQEQAPRFRGESVGMSLNRAVEIALADGLRPSQPGNVFWKAVHEHASDLLRLSWRLENGQLSAKQAERALPPSQPPQQQQPLPPAQPPQHQAPPYQPPQQQAQNRPQPGPGGQAFDPANQPDDEIPF